MLTIFYYYLLQSRRGLSETLLRLACAELKVQLVARRLVIESASLRRLNSEGSLEQQRGLGLLVQSKLSVCTFEAEMFFERTRDIFGINKSKGSIRKKENRREEINPSAVFFLTEFDVSAYLFTALNAMA